MLLSGNRRRRDFDVILHPDAFIIHSKHFYCSLQYGVSQKSLAGSYDDTPISNRFCISPLFLPIFLVSLRDLCCMVTNLRCSAVLPQWWKSPQIGMIPVVFGRRTDDYQQDGCLTSRDIRSANGSIAVKGYCVTNCKL